MFPSSNVTSRGGSSSSSSASAPPGLPASLLLCCRLRAPGRPLPCPGARIAPLSHARTPQRRAMAEWAPAQIQEWNVEAQHLMPLQPPLVPELSHMREAQLHTAEASLWSVVATVQAMERKIDLLATRLLSLEGRSGTAEKKLLDCEKTAMEFGNQLESKWAVLGTLIQEYGLLQRRLENMENLLKNRNFWVLRLPPGAKGEIPKMPVTFVDIAVYFSAEEWKNLAEWQKDLYHNLVKENYESLLSLGADVNVSKPEAHPRIERGAEPCIPDQQSSKGREISTDPCTGAEALISAHDFLSWIKQEEEPCVREHWESAERDILTGPGTAGNGMVVKAEEQRPRPEEPARSGEPLFQGETPVAAAAAAAAEAYAGPCGPVAQALSPARSRPDGAVSQLPNAVPWMESQEELHMLQSHGVPTKAELPPGPRTGQWQKKAGDVGIVIKTEAHDPSGSRRGLGQILRPCLRESKDQPGGESLQGSAPDGLLRPLRSVGLRPMPRQDEGSLGTTVPQSGSQQNPSPIAEPQQERLHCEQSMTLMVPRESRLHPYSDFQRWQDLATHQSSHGGVKQHQCARCGQCALHNSQLNYHTHTGEQPYRCGRCTSFSYQEDLQNSQRMHMGERPYSCREGGESTSHKEHLQYHQLMHTSEMAFPRNVGIVIKVEEKDLGEHHKDLEQILGPRSRDSGEQSRIRTQQENMLGEPLSFGALMPLHRCDGESHGDSVSQIGPEGSVNSVVEPQLEPLCEGKSAPPDQPAHTCSDCGEAFQRWHDLATHRSSHSKVKQHQCAHCGQRFLHRSRLNYHTRIHTGERPYSCGVCGKSYSRKEHLQNHQRLHTGEKPYQCEECGKNYSRREHLQYHQRLHTGERPFQCQACGKRFIRKQNLLKHQRVHTGERHKAGRAPVRSPTWTT
ncbi:zinc finger protein 282-like isoform X2 [Hemicordylus capensis]|uniref:zinc finger protein 282-like isoform X2 n=1 Tax=Hemicordylus capensis TaxID=884348 RepID=UPI00230277B4|nr:zinc finger protein 282-like isoform X2 [Hemicordylus capensis]